MWIKEVVVSLKEIKSFTENNFMDLSEEELIWKPSEKSWSIAECFQHIIIANSLYLKDINKKLEKAEVRTIEQPIKLSWMGKLFLYFVDPKYKWKVKAPKIFKPIEKNKVVSGGDVVNEYIKLQEDLIDSANKAVGYDHSRTYTYSPLSSLLRFNIGEQFYIMMRHEKRHLNQASRVKELLKERSKAA